MRKQYYVDLGKWLRTANESGPEALQECYDEIKEDVASRGAGNYSIRQLFEHTVENGRELVESFNPNVEGGFRFMEAGGSSQAVSTIDYGNITGQIFYNATMRSFDNPSFIHSRLMDNVDTNLDGEKIAGIGNIGDLSEAVDEGDPYPRMKPSAEFIETPQTTKRGGVVEVTKEAIFFDRTGGLLEKCSALGQVMGFNKEKRCIDLALGLTNSYKYNGTSYDTYQASTPWDNTQTSTALADWTDIEAAELLFDAMTDPLTGEPIMLMTPQLIVPTALKHTARRIVGATEINNGTDQGGGSAAQTNRATSSNPLDGYDIVTSPYVKARTSSATTWYIGDFKKAFCYMQNWGLTAAQLGMNSHLDFERDVVTAYKISERGTPAVKEPRYVVKVTA